MTTTIKPPDVRCTLCRHRFAAPAVARCPKCESRYLKPIGPITMDEHVVIALRNSARNDGRNEEADALTRALEWAGAE